MADWQNFFLQKMGTDGSGNAWPVKESVAEWGIFCKDIPFVLFGKVKEPAKRQWPDEHGDEEYVPSGLYLEAYTIKIEFGCKKVVGNDIAKYGTGSAVDDVRAKVGAFLSYLRTGQFKIYSSYTRIGRQYVRLESVSDGATWKTNGNGEFLVFEVSLKVNDPVTDVVLSVSN